MGLFNGNKGKDILIEHLWNIIKYQAETIRICCEKCKAHQVQLIYVNNKNQNMADVFLVLPGNAETGTPSLIDNETGKPVAGTVTYSNVTAVVADPTIASVTVDPVTAIAVATPLAAGQTTVTITATVAFTNSNNQAATQTQTSVMNITVTLAADGVSLVYTWA